MQTAHQAVPVRYGPTSEFNRGNDVYRRFVEEEEEDAEALPKGKNLKFENVILILMIVMMLISRIIVLIVFENQWF